MKQINTPVSVDVGRLRLTATAVDRKHGLSVSVLVSQGTTPVDSRVVQLAEPVDRMGCATALSAAYPPLTAPEVDAALLHLQAAVEAALRSGSEKAEAAPAEAIQIPAGTSLTWILSADGIAARQRGVNQTSTTVVVRGAMKPLRRVDVEDAVYFEIEDQGGRVLETAPGYVAKLTREGRVANRGLAADAVSSVLYETTRDRRERGYPALGVYENENRELVLATDVLGLRTEQRVLIDAVKPVLADTEVAAADVEAYLKLAAEFHPFEVLPSMGLAAIAPFAHILRQKHILVPHVFNFGESSDLGKSSVATAFTESLYGVPTISGGTLSSEFRRLATMDAAALPRAVEEAAAMAESAFEGLKDCAERASAGRRGRPDQGINDYASRACLILTANSMPFADNQPVLKRLVASRFDGNSRSSRRARAKQFKALQGALRPIGFAMAAFLASKFGTAAALLDHIKGIEGDLRGRQEYRGATRPTSYAVIYAGLCGWADFAASRGIVWNTFPDIDNFVKQVVRPCEESTFDAVTPSVLYFVRWFEHHQARNEDGEGFVKGEGSSWRRGTAGERPGYWVTAALLDQYNRAQQGHPSRRLTLNELARSAAFEFGVDPALVIDAKDNGARVVKWVGKGKGKGRRAAFIPEDADSEPEEGNFNGRQTSILADLRTSDKPPVSLVVEAR